MIDNLNRAEVSTIVSACLTHTRRYIVFTSTDFRTVGRNASAGIPGAIGQDDRRALPRTLVQDLHPQRSLVVQRRLEGQSCT